MRRNLLSTALAVLAVAAGVLGGCGADPDEADAGPGRQVYLQQCSTCHGAGRAGVGPAPALGASTMVSLGEPEIRRTVTEGGATMPAFGTSLTDGQLDALVTYLLSPDR